MSYAGVTKLRIQVDSMTDRIYGPTFAKRTAIPAPSNSIAGPRMLNDRAMLLKACGSSSTKRPAEEFGRWVSQVNFLLQEKKRTIPRLGKPYASPRGRTLVADSGIDIYPEIIFTLRCLEKIGYLKLENFDPPRGYGGGKENMKIIFSESMMPNPY